MYLALRTVIEQSSLSFNIDDNELWITKQGNYDIPQPVVEVTLLGVKTAPKVMLLDNKKIHDILWDEKLKRVLIKGLKLDLNGDARLRWN